MRTAQKCSLHWVLLGLLLTIVTGIVYLPVTRHEFVNFDDPDYVCQNPHVRAGLSSVAVRWAFSSIHSTNWHPLTSLSHMLDCELYGLNPAGHHLTSLLLHTVNTLLLFGFLSSVTRRTNLSALTAALFALHPLRVESVAWISERKDVLSGLFFLLTLWLYACYARMPTTPLRSAVAGRKWVCYTLAWIFFALGLLSKPMLVTTPFILLLLDIWPLERFRTDASVNSTSSDRPWNIRHLLVEKAPFFLLAAGSSLVTFLVQRASGTVMTLEHTPWSSRCFNAAVAYLRYLGKTFWPTDLAVFYPYTLFAWSSWQFWGALLVLVLVTGAVLMAARSGLLPSADQTASTTELPRAALPLLVGWLWFLGMLVPVIGLVQVGDQALADRYTYLPHIGLFVMIIWGLASIQYGRALAVLARLTSGVSLVACIVITSRQLGYWQNTQTLFERAASVTKSNHTAYANLGIYFVQQGQFEKAIDCYHQALASKTNFPHAWNNLGLALVHQRRYEEAVAAFRTALGLCPSLVGTEENLGKALAILGRAEEASAHYEAALRLKPDSVAARTYLGHQSLIQGELAVALVHLDHAVRLQPTNANTRCDLAQALLGQGQMDAAIPQFEAALDLQPGLLMARLGLGQALAQQGKLDLAIAEYSRVLQTTPDPNAHYHLALALSAQHKSNEAVSHYHAALDTAPDFVEALNNLAWLLATDAESTVRNGAEAVRCAERACILTDYRNPLLVGTLAAAYAEAGRFNEAIATAEKARDLATAAGQTQTAQRNRELLDLYRGGKPYREPQP